MSPIEKFKPTINPEKISPQQEKKVETQEKKPEASFFGKKSSALEWELKRDEYYSKLKIPKKEREEIGEMLGGVFGNYIEKGESWRAQSLIKELRNPGSSSDSKIKEIGKTIREKYGPYKARKLADIINEKFFGKK